MAKTDYNEFRALAEELITEAGQPIPLVTKGNPTLNAIGQIIAPGVDSQIEGIITPLFDYGMAEFEVNNTLVQVGDKYAFYHSNSEVEIGMMVTVNSVEWRVQSVQIAFDSVDGISVLRKIQLRR